MKNIILALFLLLFSKNYSQELLLHYSFDGNSNDISGNNYNGNPNGITYVNDRNGNPNSAVAFDGVNDFIDLPNLSELKPNFLFSVSMWIKFDDFSFSNSNFFTNDYVENNYTGIWLNARSTGEVGASIGDNSGNTTSSNRRSKSATTSLVVGNWYKITVIFKGITDISIYINCNDDLGSYSGNGGDLSYSSSPGSIGRKDSNGAFPYYFKGTIDEFKYYKGIVEPNSIDTIFTNLESEICQGASYALPTVSNNNINGTWSPVFNSSNIGTTDYTFTPDAGQCAASITQSIEIVDKINAVFTNLESEICQGESYALPTVSSNNINGSWSPIFDSSALGSTTYTFIPDLGQPCAIIITHLVEVRNKVSLNFSELPTSFRKEEIYVLPVTSDSGVSGSWMPIFSSQIIGSTVYTFTLDIYCASIYTHSINIIEDTNLAIPSFFTPNGDNINDFWFVKGLNNYKEIKIIIFDRYGNIMEEINPNVGWGGIFKGKNMPSNDYWYSINAKSINGDILIKKGHFSLLRK